MCGMSTEIQISEVKKACELAGGQASLARALGVTPPTISQWASGERPVPIIQACAIELAFPATSRRRFRPDDWHLIWPELASEAA
jgi:DNA-binding transcriptional regulator YdaS (Cro superfamily)